MKFKKKQTKNNLTAYHENGIRQERESPPLQDQGRINLHFVTRFTSRRLYHTLRFKKKKKKT